MSDDTERIAKAIEAHGDQLGGNLVHLKRFLDAKQIEQQEFLEQQRLASEAAQGRAHRAALWSALAAGAAAIAAIFQAYAAWVSP